MRQALLQRQPGDNRTPLQGPDLKDTQEHDPDVQELEATIRMDVRKRAMERLQEEVLKLLVSQVSDAAIWLFTNGAITSSQRWRIQNVGSAERAAQVLYDCIMRRDSGYVFLLEYFRETKNDEAVNLMNDAFSVEDTVIRDQIRKILKDKFVMEDDKIKRYSLLRILRQKFKVHEVEKGGHKGIEKIKETRSSTQKHEKKEETAEALE